MFLSKKKRISYLRSIWGMPIDKRRNLELIASYHNMLKSSNSNSFFDDKTWNDLNLDSVFSNIDRDSYFKKGDLKDYFAIELLAM